MSDQLILRSDGPWTIWRGEEVPVDIHYAPRGADCAAVAHAAANERNAIIAFLQHEMQANYDVWEDGVDPSGQERGIALSNAWNDIANGRHHQEQA
jgi:hypothetical protein